MKEKTLEKINKLYLGKNEKDILLNTDKIVNSKVEAIRNNHPVLVITADDDCGFSEYSKAYSEIVDAADANALMGSGTYLELTFPKDNEKDERLFYASPKQVARNRNDFPGTMPISLDEHSGEDLILSESFPRLINFIDDNKKKTHFIIKIRSDFSAKNQLIARLQEVVNVVEGSLVKPDLQTAYEYVTGELDEMKCEIDASSLKDLKNKILKPALSMKSYAGYRSLDRLADKLLYHAVLEMEDDRIVIDKKVINKLAATLIKENESAGSDSVKIGFRV